MFDEYISGSGISLESLESHSPLQKIDPHTDESIREMVDLLRARQPHTNKNNVQEVTAGSGAEVRAGILVVSR